MKLVQFGPPEPRRGTSRVEGLLTGAKLLLHEKQNRVFRRGPGSTIPGIHWSSSGRQSAAGGRAEPKLLLHEKKNRVFRRGPGIHGGIKLVPFGPPGPGRGTSGAKTSLEK